ncbi:MAG: thiamine phosphate synthase [Nitrospirae bacterium]|nr:MAG: thiamine phosphate synthase [Nitrospirota bacterium]
MIDFKLYLITDRKVVRGDLLHAVRDALEGGVKAVQLREKDLPVREYVKLAEDMRTLTSEFGARLFINERVDIALSVGADGVHLGYSGIPPDVGRTLIGKEMMLGVSTHSVPEAIEAEMSGADFITFGPVYETPSKRKYGKPQGLENLRLVAKKVSIPVFGIGGIKKTNIVDVLSTGASGIALISGILAASDIRAEAQEYVRKAV